MKPFSVILVVALFASCGPRDDESLLGGGQQGGQGSSLKQGETITQAEPGKKLPSCSDGPTWKTIRLYHEASFIYPQVDQLEIVVGKGDFNCVPVSDNNTVEIELETAPDSEKFNPSGVRYSVSKIEMRNTQEFLGDEGLFNKAAKGMRMTPQQLRDFLQASPQKPVVTLTYLTTGEKNSSPSQVEYVVPKGVTLKTTAEKAKLPTCSDEAAPTWSTLRLPFEFQKSADKGDSLTVVLGKGGRNCLQVSSQSTVALELQKSANDKNYVETGSHFLVWKLELLNTEDFLADLDLIKSVASEMGMTIDELKSHLNTEPLREQVTLTYLEASEPIEPPTQLSSVEYFSLPEAQGKTASQCNGQVWTSLRVASTLKKVVLEVVERQKRVALVAENDRNCVAIGSEVVLAFQDDQKKWQEDPSKTYKVVSVVIRARDDYKRDIILAESVASEMGMTLDKFMSFIDGMKSEKINITRLEWLEN